MTKTNKTITNASLEAADNAAYKAAIAARRLANASGSHSDKLAALAAEAAWDAASDAAFAYRANAVRATFA